MGFAVAHVSKCSGSSGGLSDHIDRTQKKGRVSKNIDVARSDKNFELAKVSGRIDEMVKARIQEGYTGKNKIRKDAVTSCRYIVSGSHDDMMKLSEIEVKKWTVDNYNFFAEMYGEKNIIRATVHLDETTPHMHIIVVPLTDDGRLSAKEYIGNKKKLKDFQTDYWKKVGKKYGLQRGIENSKATHTELAEYYRRVNAPIEANISIPTLKLFESNEKYLERVKSALKPLIFGFDKIKKQNKDFKKYSDTLINSKKILDEERSKIDLEIKQTKDKTYKSTYKRVIDNVNNMLKNDGINKEFSLDFEKKELNFNDIKIKQELQQEHKHEHTREPEREREPEQEQREQENNFDFGMER